MKILSAPFLLIGLLFFLFFGGSDSFCLWGQLTPEVIFEKSNPAVVELGKGQARGTGFFIKENLLVTCYHVVRGIPGLKVYLGQDSFEIKGWRALDSIKDLAILEVDYSSSHVLNLQTDLPKVGSPVYVIGSSLGRTNTFSNGIVSKILDANENPHQIQFTAPSTFGNSGGPILNSNGFVLGVVTQGSWLVGQNLNVATAALEIDLLLQSLSPEAQALEEVIETESLKENELLLASLNFKRYRFGNYSVELPKEWVIKDGEGIGGLIFTASSPIEHSEDVYRENISLVEGTGVFQGNKMGLLVYLSTLKKTIPEFDLIEMNHEAEWPYLHFSGVSNSYIPFQSLCYLFNEAPNNYMIELGFEAYEDLKRFGLVYQRILKSIERK